MSEDISPIKYAFKIYSWFNPAPGQPKELKCATCKRITFAACMLGASSCCLAVVRTKRKPYLSLSLTGIGAAFGLGALLAFRGAMDDDAYNDVLIKQTQAKIKAERQERRESVLKAAQ